MKGFSKTKLKGMYERMYLIRKYEERIYYLFLEGVMPGTIHQSHGQEACAVGMLYDLSEKDYCCLLYTSRYCQNRIMWRKLRSRLPEMVRRQAPPEPRL